MTEHVPGTYDDIHGEPLCQVCGFQQPWPCATAREQEKIVTKRVLKWNVDISDAPTRIGGGPVVLVAMQRFGGDTIQVWTEETGPPTRWVRVFGTGHDVPSGFVHLGSAMTADGSLVWHVYDVVGAR